MVVWRPRLSISGGSINQLATGRTVPSTQVARIEVSNMTTFTIKPAPRGGEGAQLTHGTKVMSDDGAELTGVTGITLTAGLDDVWRANVELNRLLLPPEGIRAEFRFVHNFPHAEQLIADIFRQIIEYKPTGLTVEYDESGEVLLGVKII